MGSNLNLLQGTLDLLVLKALAGGEAMHGYGVAGWVREVTEGALEIEEGALYTSLHRMEKRGWIASEWGLSDNNRKAKFYVLTAAGRRQLGAEASTWTQYVAAVEKVMRAEAS
jgi:transcriptional regulator